MTGSTFDMMDRAGKAQVLRRIAHDLEGLAEEMTDPSHDNIQSDLLPRTIETLQNAFEGLRGPHDMLHEFVASNWDAAALRCLLESGLLDLLSINGTMALEKLSQCSKIPQDKLWRILRLLVCRDFLRESTKGHFTLSPTSTAIHEDKGLKAFLGFQLFETRVAGAYLADAMRAGTNEGRDSSAFSTAFGTSLYSWHAARPTKAAQFRLAMQSVASTLDPADSLFKQYFDTAQPTRGTRVLEIGGRYGYASYALAEHFSNPTYSIWRTSPEFPGPSSVPSIIQDRIEFLDPSSDLSVTKADIILMRNVLWDWTDDSALELLATLFSIIKQDTNTVLIFADSQSPSDEDHYELAKELIFRRRDLTMMAMHNIKSRTRLEWEDLFRTACRDVDLKMSAASSSHALKIFIEARVHNEVSTADDNKTI